MVLACEGIFTRDFVDLMAARNLSGDGDRRLSTLAVFLNSSEILEK